MSVILTPTDHDAIEPSNPKPSTDLPFLLDTNEVSILTGLSVAALEKYRYLGTRGPRFIKLGPLPNSPVRYRVSDIEAYIREHNPALYEVTSNTTK